MNDLEGLLERIAIALERIAKAIDIDKKIVRITDVDRAKVLQYPSRKEVT